MYESIPNELRTMEASSKRMEPYKRGLLHRAAKAIEELSMKLHGDEAAIAGMKREIERMVVAGKPRWIPVTERLPEPYVDVIATDGENVGVASYQEKGNYWLEDGLFDDTHVEVTHWMLLPEPPKEAIP